MRKQAETENETAPEVLKGWKKIAEFLGEPVSVVKRWKSEGMPVVEQGRFVTTTPEQLNTWLGQESGKPVHVVTPETDLAAELKRGVAFLKRNAKHSRSREASSAKVAGFRCSLKRQHWPRAANDSDDATHFASHQATGRSLK
jgi:hypothetical protein